MCALMAAALLSAAPGLGAPETNGVTMKKLLTKLERGEQVTIVALGDSNTELTFHTRGHLNWVYLLQEALFEKYGANRVIMIDAGHCGEGSEGGLKRLDHDVLRFEPDLVIICYWDANEEAMTQLVRRVQKTGAEVLLRTPNPAVVPNMPAVTPPLPAGKEWPDYRTDVAGKIVALGKKLDVPVVDHYTAWLKADASHAGPGVTNPNKLWMRMSDATHPGPLGHLAFYRELAPFFGLPEKLSWEF